MDVLMSHIAFVGALQTFEGTASTSERYMSHLAAAWSAFAEPCEGKETRINEPLRIPSRWQMTHFPSRWCRKEPDVRWESGIYFLPRCDWTLKGVSALVTCLLPEELKREFDLDAETLARDIPLWMCREWIHPGMVRPEFTGYIGAGLEESLRDSIRFVQVPQYVPAPEIRIPFLRRRHRIFCATPTEDVICSYPVFYEPIRQLRESGYPLVVIGRQKGNPLEYASQDAYCRAVIQQVNHYTHFWLDWREYRYLLGTTGIYLRHSWQDTKTGIVEALAYGNRVVLTREHSTLLYDPQDVRLIPHGLVLEETEIASVQQAVLEELEWILTSPESASHVQAISSKYRKRHAFSQLVKRMKDLQWQ